VSINDFNNNSKYNNVIFIQVKLDSEMSTKSCTRN
jgi:hypothetical protein